MEQLKTSLNNSLSREDRSWPRRSCGYVTEYRDLSGMSRKCKVINISGSGLCVELSYSLRSGEIVHIVDPYVTAKVIWFSKGRAGLQVYN